MRARVLPEHLARAVKELKNIAPNRATVPAAEDILIETVGGRLRLTATDFEQSVSYYIGAQVEAEGAVTAPARELARMLPKMDGEILTIEREGKSIFRLSGERRTLTLGGHEPEDFPPVPEPDDMWKRGAALSAFALAEGLQRTEFCAYPNEDQPVLRTVHFEPVEGGYELAAADTYRIAVFPVPLLPFEDQTGELPGFNLPHNTAKALIRMVKANGKNWTYYDLVDIYHRPATDSQPEYVAFRFKDVEVVSGTISGRAETPDKLTAGYPNYDPAIPKPPFVHKLTMNRDEALNEAQAAYEVAKEGGQFIRIEGETDAVRFSARAEAIGNFETRVSARIDGPPHEPCRIALNGGYLIDALRAFDKETVMLELWATDKACILRQENGDGYYAIMPMFVQWPEPKE